MTALPIMAADGLQEIVGVLSRMCESCAWKARALKAEDLLSRGTDEMIRNAGIPKELFEGKGPGATFSQACSRIALDMMERKLYGARRVQRVLEREVLATEEGRQAYDEYCQQLGDQAQTVLAADKPTA